jgi:Tfp pilus assembly protein PilO
MSLSRREKILITLLLVVGVGVLYVNYLIFPLYDQLMANRQILSQKQAVLDELTELSKGSNLENEEARVDELVSQMDEKIPDDTMLPLLYLDVLEMVGESGAALESVDFNVPSKENDPGYEGLFLNSIEFKVILMGNYQNLDDFVGLV